MITKLKHRIPGSLMSIIFRRKQYKERAVSCYEALVCQARHPWFYDILAVPDTLDGRFEMICLHVALLLHRLRDVPLTDPAFSCVRDFGQSLYDRMFADFDASLREMAVSDLGVGKRVKDMVKAFHGRLNAYGDGLEGRQDLAEALGRNVYGTVAGASPHAKTLAEYSLGFRRHLDAIANQALVQGEYGKFPEPCLVYVSAA